MFSPKIFTFVAIKSPPFFVGAGLFFSQKSVAKGKKPLLISIFFCGKGVRGNGRSCKKNRKRKRKESAENREFRNVQKDGDRGVHRHKTSSFFQKGTGTTPITDKIFFIPTRSRTHGSRHRRTTPPNRPVRLPAPQGFSSAGSPRTHVYMNSYTTENRFERGQAKCTPRLHELVYNPSLPQGISSPPQDSASAAPAAAGKFSCGPASIFKPEKGCRYIKKRPERPCFPGGPFRRLPVPFIRLLPLLLRQLERCG